MDKSFQSLTISSDYDSDVDDILNDFYIPILSNTKLHYRKAGYFSSKLLANLGRGLKNFILNGGKMKLITGIQFTDEDLQLLIELNEITEETTQIIYEELSEELLNEMEKDYLLAISWMLKQEILEIKVAVPEKYLKGNTTSYFHQKSGIFFDFHDNIVSFAGSINESLNAWENNIENFSVFCSWKGEMRHITPALKKFEKFWDDRGEKTRTFTLPEAIKRKIIEKSESLSKNDVIERLVQWEKKLKDNRINEMRLTGWKVNSDTLRYAIHNIPMRNYQIEALNYLKKNNYLGLLAMATGTGKTLTALNAVFILSQSLEKLLILVVVPDKYLVKQWMKNISDISYQSVEVSGSRTSWEKKIKDCLSYFKYEKSITHQFIIITQRSFNEKFKNLIFYYSKIDPNNIMLLFDEVHSIGAPVIRINIDNFYDHGKYPKYRIGLSATPFRKYDEEGTDFILEYLNVTDKELFELDIKFAQSNSFLKEYYFYFRKVVLTESEIKKINYLSNQILQIIVSGGDKGFKAKLKESNQLQILLLKRSRIIKKAKNKIEVFKNLLQQIERNEMIWDTVIYCEDNVQVNEVIAILNKYFPNLKYGKFDGSVDNDQREILLEKSKNREINLIVAMKCLDQGVDAPNLKRGIFVSVSASPLQHIQRIGRLLRKNKGDSDIAEIYHLLCIPPYFSKNEFPKGYEYVKKTEINISKNLAKYAINGITSILDIEELFL